MHDQTPKDPPDPNPSSLSTHTHTHSGSLDTENLDFRLFASVAFLSTGASENVHKPEVDLNGASNMPQCSRMLLARVISDLAGRSRGFVVQMLWQSQ